MVSRKVACYFKNFFPAKCRYHSLSDAIIAPNSDVRIVSMLVLLVVRNYKKGNFKAEVKPVRKVLSCVYITDTVSAEK
jgi:hypothetical protein